MKQNDEREWIAETRGRYTKFIIVRASSRKEAEEKLAGFGSEDVEAVDSEFTETSRRVIRENK